jgi:hypothetical protein
MGPGLAGGQVPPRVLESAIGPTGTPQGGQDEQHR